MTTHPEFDQFTYDHDDVPCYLDFIVCEAPHGTFPASFRGTNFQTAPRFLDLVGDADIVLLRDATFANVKIVRSIKFTDGMKVPGTAKHNGRTMMFTADGARNSTIVIHECGHNAGLEHPDAPDHDRLMWAESLTEFPSPAASEIIRFEAVAFNGLADRDEYLLLDQ